MEYKIACKCKHVYVVAVIQDRGLIGMKHSVSDCPECGRGASVQLIQNKKGEITHLAFFDDLPVKK